MFLYGSGKVEIGLIELQLVRESRTKIYASIDGGKFNQVRWEGFPRYHALGRGKWEGIGGREYELLRVTQQVILQHPAHFFLRIPKCSCPMVCDVSQDFWHLSHCAPSGSCSYIQGPCGIRVAVDKAPETKK